MADNLAMTIVLALGAGVLGGPDALNLFLTIAGQSPLVDVAISVFLIAALTAPILGTILLTLFFRKLDIAAGAGGGAPGAAAARDLLAKMTLMVSMAVASLITACFLVTLFVDHGGTEELCLLLSFAGKSPLVAAATAAAVVLATMPLACFIRDREARSAAVAGGSESPVVPARALSSKIALLVPLAGAFLFLVAGYLLVIPFPAAEPGPDGVTLSCSA